MLKCHWTRKFREMTHLILFCNQGHSPFPGSGTLRKCYCITFHGITTIYHVTGNTQHRYKNAHHKFCFNPYTMKCSIPLQRKSKPNRNVLPFPSSSKQVLIINKCPTCLPPLTHKKNVALIFSSFLPAYIRKASYQKIRVFLLVILGLFTNLIEIKNNSF